MAFNRALPDVEIYRRDDNHALHVHLWTRANYEMRVLPKPQCWHWRWWSQRGDTDWHRLTALLDLIGTDRKSVSGRWYELPLADYEAIIERTP